MTELAGDLDLKAELFFHLVDEEMVLKAHYNDPIGLSLDSDCLVLIGIRPNYISTMENFLAVEWEIGGIRISCTLRDGTLWWNSARPSSYPSGKLAPLVLMVAGSRKITQVDLLTDFVEFHEISGAIADARGGKLRIENRQTQLELDPWAGALDRYIETTANNEKQD